MRRHDSVRDALARWLKTRNITVSTEQSVPSWDTPKERAILDLWVVDPDTAVPVYVDVAIVASATQSCTPATTLLARRERTKHLRYPGNSLVPFVLDARGRWGNEAVAWAKGLLRHLSPADRQEALWELRWEVAQALHTAVAEQCLTSFLGVQSRKHG